MRDAAELLAYGQQRQALGPARGRGVEHLVGGVSAGLRADSMHPDLTTIALDDVDPSHVVLATRAGDRSRLVVAFRKCAQERLTGLGPATDRATDPAQA